MTIVAARGGVLAGERKASLAVVHGFAVGLPMNQRKVRAIVFGMAAHAVFAGRIRRQPHGVHPLPLRYALPDLCVTIQTFKLNSRCRQIRGISCSSEDRKAIRALWTAPRERSVRPQERPHIRTVGLVRNRKSSVDASEKAHLYAMKGEESFVRVRTRIQPGSDAHL